MGMRRLMVLGILVLVHAGFPVVPTAVLGQANKADELERGHLLNEIETAIDGMRTLKVFNVMPLPEEGTGQPLVQLPVRGSSYGRLDTSLTVAYGLNRIWNVKEQRAVTVHLRSYEGSLAGPTLRVLPGDLLSVRMVNNLPPNKPRNGDDINVPHGFNTTNLHTHGLHVSPAGNSDNILVMIEPKQQFQNEIHIPRDHAPGTYWYHAHVHGSTAIQVSSGMAGALIVQGGLDDVAEIRAAKDQILLFQQVPYVKAATGEVYEIEDYSQFSPSDWAAGVANQGWRTTINGQTQPSLHFYPGELQRWRLIQTGQRELVDVCLIEHKQALKLLQQEATPDAYHAAAVPFHEIAADGLAYGFKWRRQHVDLYPGYRSDVLVRIDSPGIYVLLDLDAPASKSLNEVKESPKLLAVVHVDGREGAGRIMPLPSDRDLEHLRPHRSVTDEEVTEIGHDGQAMLRLQRLKFQIRSGNDPEATVFGAGDPGPDGTAEINPFGQNGVRQLQLGKADEWHLTAEVGNHPFHVHVNPFEIIFHPRMTGAEQPRDEAGKLRTIWKDTLIVPNNSSAVRIRTRYERYIGKFVLHCHILDHEDQGMMQLLEIVGPGAGDEHHGH